MIIDKRQKDILDAVAEKNYCSVEELSQRIFASTATVRRDLISLSKAGLIKRVRGGASVISPTRGEISDVVRKQTNVTEKKRIAVACLPFVKEGESYFFDSSTTVSKLIPLLKGFSNITIVTNGFQNAYALSACASFPCYVAGGSIAPNVSSATGADTVRFISGFSCDAFFFSCRGLSLNGASEGTVEQQRVKAAMLLNSKKHILLVDKTKFGKDFTVKDASLDDIDVIVCDEEPSEEYRKAFEEKGIQLIIADK